jgi:3-dehydroquinate synthase
VYEVDFRHDALEGLQKTFPENGHLLVDRRVADLYGDALPILRGHRSLLLIDATEENKSLERCPQYVEHLLQQNARRNEVLVAVGGGIIQDITCFLAATFLRGVEWHFYPTTLLAQADSCIGSKSSINAACTKNVMGTFTPPARVTIDPAFLGTLSEVDVRSGIGEMLKVHAIQGPAAFDAIAADYTRLMSDESVMLRYIRKSLEIKKQIVEVDEFDRGPRNVMNYGHSFGHAIEAATDFAIPHGIAVTIGMDLANYVSVQRGLSSMENFRRMHPTLARNYAGFERAPIPLEPMLGALKRDKKNVDSSVVLILPQSDGQIRQSAFPLDAGLRALCATYLDGVRTSP